MNEDARLGLALSGGGFRAAFFHLGVLRRLAELDLLRHLSVISTVSGGSIIGAHYYLLVKHQYETRKGVLTRDDYRRIVKLLEREFLHGNRKDLRNLLFMDPRTHFRVLALGRSFGTPMAALYAKHLYGRASRSLFGEKYAEGGVPMHRTIIQPPGREGGVEDFPSSGYPGSGKSGMNLVEVNASAGVAKIPRLVINATCLNTGGRFSFTHNEVGGPETGYIRTDEVFMLFQYKILIETMELNPAWTMFATAQAGAEAWGPDLETRYDELPKTAFHPTRLPLHTEEHLRLYLAARAKHRSGRGIPSAEGFANRWAPRSEVVRAFLDPEATRLLDHLLSVDFGRLRRAKIPAWYLLDPWDADRVTRGGFTRQQYLTEFWRALNDIDSSFEKQFRDEDEPVELATIILDFYYFRSAEQISWDAPRTLSELSVSRIVAASANFPPVFTPMKIFDLFDATKFGAICLTDGGVHDNQGINALLDDRCNYIIGSDAGGLVESQPLPADSRVPMMNRIIDVLMGGLRSVQINSVDESLQLAALLERTVPAERSFKALHDEARQRYNLKRAAVFHITSNPLDGREDGLEPLLSEETARIRTDLDEFNDVEVAVLKHAGYQLADRYTDWFAADPRSPFRGNAPPPFADSLPEREHAERILRGSRKVAGRLSETYPLHAAIVSLTLALIFLRFHVLSLKFLQAFWDFEPKSATQPGQFVLFLRTVSIWKTCISWRSWLKDRMLPVSVLALVFAIWALYTLARFFYQSWRARRSEGIIEPADEQAKALRFRRLGVFFRVRNVISYFCIWMFVVTMHPKWLLGVVPLWSIPFAILFAFMHFVPRYLWRIAGRMPPRPTESATVIDQV